MSEDGCGPDCECAMCKYGPEAVAKWEAEQVAKHGWYAHLVQDDTNLFFGFNCHTHGIQENLHHPDLQIVLPMDAQTCLGILHSVVAKIREGKQFKHGDMVEGIIQDGYKVLFINARECDRNVLRIILPDKDGNLEPSSMHWTFDHQHDL